MDHTHDDKIFGWCSRCTKWIIVLVGVLLSLFLLAKALHEFKLVSIEGRNIYPSNVISVRGTGEAFRIPDVATFTYAVTESGKTVPDAQKLATDKGNKAIDFLKENGIDAKDVKTVSYSINPKYEYKQGTPCNNFGCPPGRQVLTGYEVSQMILVKVRKTEDSGKILSGIGTLGVSNVSGLTFSVEDEEAVKAEARKKAIDDARAKAKELSRDLGVTLVRVVNFYEDGAIPGPMFYGKEMSLGMDAMNQSTAAPQIPAGENTVTSNITITYEIR